MRDSCCRHVRNEIELRERVQTSLEGKNEPDSGDGGTEEGSLQADMWIGGLKG